VSFPTRVSAIGNPEAVRAFGLDSRLLGNDTQKRRLSYWDGQAMEQIAAWRVISTAIDSG
jgi:hypothetical protein